MQTAETTSKRKLGRLTTIAMVIAVSWGAAAWAATDATTAKPKITKFKAPASVSCSGPTQIKLKWNTQNANQVTISIDGPGIFDTYPANGTAMVPFACDGNSHTYMLTAIGNGGKHTSTTRTVNPSLVPRR